MLFGVSKGCYYIDNDSISPFLVVNSLEWSDTMLHDGSRGGDELLEGPAGRCA